jgi:hypothetical protein
VLGEYIAPGPRDAVATVDRLIELLDNQEIEATLMRVEAREGARGSRPRNRLEQGNAIAKTNV